MNGKIQSLGTNFRKEPETKMQIRPTVLRYPVHHILKPYQIVFSKWLHFFPYWTIPCCSKEIQLQWARIREHIFLRVFVKFLPSSKMYSNRTCLRQPLHVWKLYLSFLGLEFIKSRYLSFTPTCYRIWYNVKCCFQKSSMRVPVYTANSKEF